MKKINAKKIATWIIVPLMAAIFILDISTVVIANKHCRNFSFTKETFDYSSGDDRIHFLNTANSDSILIESNGMFALVDAGEGNNNPRRKTEYKGYEKEVCDYIKKVCKTDRGVYLEFILGTHCHYDHIGSFETLIKDPGISIGKAYFKVFNPGIAKEYEVERWKIGETYNQIIEALNGKSVPVISNLPDTPFSFGDFTLQFYNTVTPVSLAGKGENAASVGVKITKGERSVFLAADITESTGLEQLVEDEVGDIDILKAGHHGYFGSSSSSFLEKLNPELIIVTNQLGKVYPNIKWNFTMKAKVPFFATYDNNGIIVTLADDGKMIFTNDIH